MPMRGCLILCACLLLLQVWARTPNQMQGYASYYSKSLKGKRTSNGGRYAPKSLTAAHRTWPLGSKVLVLEPQSGKKMEVTITDRGPHSRKRVIDLSYAAAKRLGLLRKGIGKVHITLIDSLRS